MRWQSSTDKPAHTAALKGQKRAAMPPTVVAPGDVVGVVPAEGAVRLSSAITSSAGNLQNTQPGVLVVGTKRQSTSYDVQSSQRGYRPVVQDHVLGIVSGVSFGRQELACLAHSRAVCKTAQLLEIHAQRTWAQVSAHAEPASIMNAPHVTCSSSAICSTVMISICESPDGHLARVQAFLLMSTGWTSGLPALQFFQTWRLRMQQSAIGQT